MTPAARSWLRLQLGMAVVGGVLWYTGVRLDSDFTSGLGTGVIVSALVLRLMRRGADGPG